MECLSVFPAGFVHGWAERAPPECTHVTSGATGTGSDTHVDPITGASDRRWAEITSLRGGGSSTVAMIV